MLYVYAQGSKGRRNLSGEGSETTTEKGATTVTKEDGEEEEVHLQTKICVNVRRREKPFRFSSA